MRKKYFRIQLLQADYFQENYCFATVKSICGINYLRGLALQEKTTYFSTSDSG
ncbi:MAG: hypothetical protein MRJ65_03390 [Candidatus Brocadiaceae bacterium]|nr:hypothetical protein [Candidatus Brocadiaceae bacterium]